MTTAVLGEAVELTAGFFGGMHFSGFTGSDARTVDDNTAGLSNLNDLVLTDYPLINGLAAGGRLSVSFFGSLAVISELSFSQQGNRWNGTALVERLNDTVVSAITVERRLNYFSLPVLVAFKPRCGRFSPFVYAGPSFSFNCFAESKSTVDQGASSKSDIKFFTYGGVDHDLVVYYGAVSAGGGLSFAAGGNEWMVDARYNAGMTSIIRDKKITMSSLSVAVGVMVPR